MNASLCIGRADDVSSGVQDRVETRRGSLDGTEVLQGVQLGSPVRQSCPETEVELSWVTTSSTSTVGDPG